MSDASLIGRLSTSSSRASIWAIGVVVLVAVPVFGGGSIVAFEVFAVVFGWSAFIRIARHSSVLRWTWLLALLWAFAQVVSNLSHARYYLSSPRTTMVGQCHRYSEYEMSPMYTLALFVNGAR